MYIVPSEIEKSCKKIGDEIHVEVSLEDSEAIFRFVRGKYEMNGNTAVLMSGREIFQLLELNNIIGDNGEVQKVLNSSESDPDENIHSLIYTTIAKYVLQMLNAAMGKDYFPEIEALQQHEQVYFHRNKMPKEA